MTSFTNPRRSPHTASVRAGMAPVIPLGPSSLSGPLICPRTGQRNEHSCVRNRTKLVANRTVLQLGYAGYCREGFFCSYAHACTQSTYFGNYFRFDLREFSIFSGRKVSKTGFRMEGGNQCTLVHEVLRRSTTLNPVKYRRHLSIGDRWRGSSRRAITNNR